MYRTYEVLQVYGTTIKALIHEEFGDGIMSAVNFSLSVDREDTDRGPTSKDHFKRRVPPLPGTCDLVGCIGAVLGAASRTPFALTKDKPPGPDPSPISWDRNVKCGPVRVWFHVMGDGASRDPLTRWCQHGIPQGLLDCG